MPQKSPIEWTDYTSNPIYVVRKSDGKRGWHCCKVSPECDNCYAVPIDRRFGTGLPYHQDYDDQVEWVLSLQELKALHKLPAGSKVFVGDMLDIFHKDVPRQYLEALFAIFSLTPWATFQVLTKRHARMRSFMKEITVDAIDGYGDAFAESLFAAGFTSKEVLAMLEKAAAFPNANPSSPILPNVWCGVSAGNQQWFDLRWPALRDIPAAVRFISYEPAIGPVVLPDDAAGNLHWLIAGGESGQKARPMHPDWARSLRDQCQGAGVAFFFKQNGEYVSYLGSTFQQGDVIVYDTETGKQTETLRRVGKKAAGRLLDGREWNEFPEVK